MSAKKPVIIVTRKLPDVVEARLRELFDARLNADDKPLTQAQLVEAVKTADVLVPTVTDRIDRGVISQAGPQLRLIANFGTGVDNIDLDTARNKGITVTNTPGVLTEDTADMTMALILAVPRRLAEGTSYLKDPKNQWTGWSPTWMLGHRIYGKRLGIIGMGRIGTAVARRAKAFGLQIHYHNRRRVASGGEGTGGDLLGKPRSDAVACGHRIGELPAYAGDVPPAVGAPPEAAEAVGLYRQHRARRSHRRERAGAPGRAGSIAGAGLDVFEHEPAVNPRLSSLGSSWRCRTWARPPSKAVSIWARRSSSTSRPISTGSPAGQGLSGDVLKTRVASGRLSARHNSLVQPKSAEPERARPVEGQVDDAAIECDQHAPLHGRPERGLPAWNE